MKQPYLIGKLVYLRPLQLSDAEPFAQWLNDARITRTLRVRPPLTVAAEREWIERVAADPNTRVCALVRRSDDKVIGSSGLHDLDWQARSACFGIKIGIPALWGRGYGSEATRLWVDHAFETLNMNRVWLEVHSTNPGGRRAYEKAGFQLEGIQREAVYREGRYADLLIMGLLRSEWVRSRTPKKALARGRAAQA